MEDKEAIDAAIAERKEDHTHFKGEMVPLSRSVVHDVYIAFAFRRKKSVAELMEHTKLPRATVIEALNHLVSIGKIDTFSVVGGIDQGVERRG